MGLSLSIFLQTFWSSLLSLVRQPRKPPQQDAILETIARVLGEEIEVVVPVNQARQVHQEKGLPCNRSAAKSQSLRNAQNQYRRAHGDRKNYSQLQATPTTSTLKPRGHTPTHLEVPKTTFSSRSNLLSPLPSPVSPMEDSVLVVPQISSSISGSPNPHSTKSRLSPTHSRTSLSPSLNHDQRPSACRQEASHVSCLNVNVPILRFDSVPSQPPNVLSAICGILWDAPNPHSTDNLESALLPQATQSSPQACSPHRKSLSLISSPNNRTALSSSTSSPDWVGSGIRPRFSQMPYPDLFDFSIYTRTKHSSTCSYDEFARRISFSYSGTEGVGEDFYKIGFLKTAVSTATDVGRA